MAVRGTVTIARPCEQARWTPHEGDGVFFHDVVVTGSSSAIRILLAGGVLMAVEENTTVEMTSALLPPERSGASWFCRRMASACRSLRGAMSAGKGKKAPVAGAR